METGLSPLSLRRTAPGGQELPGHRAAGHGGQLIHTHEYLYVYMYMYVCMYVYIYIYIYIYTYDMIW